MGRIVRRRDDDAVGESRLAPAVVGENRVGNGRGRGVFIPLRDHDLHAVGRQHLKRAGKRRHGERMRVHAEKQRAIDLLLLPVQANGLTDGEDMPFVESLVECGTAMSRGAEGHPLRRHRRVRRLRIVGRDESGHVHQHRWFGRLSCERAYFHVSPVKCVTTFAPRSPSKCRTVGWNLPRHVGVVAPQPLGRVLIDHRQKPRRCRAEWPSSLVLYRTYLFAPSLLVHGGHHLWPLDEGDAATAQAIGV